MIYFIQEGNSGPIKIGKSLNPLDRLSTFQSASPRELHLLGTLDEQRFQEKDLHHYFSKDRIRGEWFDASSDLLKFINASRNADSVIDLESQIRSSVQARLISIIKSTNKNGTNESNKKSRNGVVSCPCGRVRTCRKCKNKQIERLAKRFSMEQDLCGILWWKKIAECDVKRMTNRCQNMCYRLGSEYKKFPQGDGSAVLIVNRREILSAFVTTVSSGDVQTVPEGKKLLEFIASVLDTPEGKRVGGSWLFGKVIEQ